MILEYHIAQLLYRYQCVTVHNFGAFLTETISANIQESNQTFYPPKKVISFNVNIKNNDGLLANHIVATQKMLYGDALIAINNQVNTWKLTLENNEAILLKNIGSITKNSDGNLFFEPTESVNFLTESFGLNTFVSPIVKREAEKDWQIQGLNQNTELVYETKNYVNQYLKYAAIFLVSVGGAAFGYSYYLNNQEIKETLIVQNEVQATITSKIQEATFFIDNPLVETATTSTVSTLPFHIMAGSFRNENNANQELKNLISKGFKARILPKNSQGLFPVVYGSFVTYTEAQYKLTEIQNTLNTEAWLLMADY